MKYPIEKITLPTIYFSACGATQFAAEAFFPPQTFIQEKSNKREKDLHGKQGKQDEKAFLNSKYCNVLLAGINEYGRLGNLNGCINDVNDVKFKLLSYGFDIKRIKTLIDEQASKDRILEELSWLVSHCKEEDSLYFHFSGHGSWTLTKDGSGWESCICCADWLRTGIMV